jgi:hypothetical protein
MIYKKLLEFQKKNITVQKKGKNPHFQSKYATLNEVLDKVRKPLNDLNILILQTPDKEGLKTTLIDLDDSTEVSCFMPYTAETTTAQKLGSNNTYNRRYSLVTLLGLEDEDDDGNVASAKPKAVVKPVVTTVKRVVKGEETPVNYEDPF